MQIKTIILSVTILFLLNTCTQKPKEPSPELLLLPLANVAPEDELQTVSPKSRIDERIEYCENFAEDNRLNEKRTKQLLAECHSDTVFSNQTLEDWQNNNATTRQGLLCQCSNDGWSGAVPVGDDFWTAAVICAVYGWLNNAQCFMFYP